MIFAALTFVAPVSWAVSQIATLAQAGPHEWAATVRDSGYEARILRHLGEDYGGGDYTFYLDALAGLPAGAPICLTQAAARILFTPWLHTYETDSRQFRNVRGACPVAADACSTVLLGAADMCRCPDGVTCRTVGR